MAEALVEYDYKAQELDELTIKKGDIITNISFKPGGWWEGTLLNGGKRGMFPDNFVKLIRTEDGVAPATASSGRRCKVLFPYSAAKEDELDLQVGDIIDIISEVEEGWWKGSLKNRVGVFPSNFVSEITDASKPEKEAALRKSKVSRDESLKQPLGMNSGSSNSETQSSLKSESPTDVPVLPPKPAKEYCRVMYKYEANNSDELNLHRGDIITIITKEGQDPGWWKGELKGKIGVFPDNFVEMITLEEATKTELKTKMSNRIGMAISKSATTSSISDTLNISSLSRKFSDTSKTAEDKVPPSVSKKPVLPPPPTSKKPSPSLPSPKMIESSQPGKVVTSSTTTIKHGSSVISETSSVSSSSSKWTVVESGDSADGISWSKQSYSLKSDKKSSENVVNSVTGVSVTSGELTGDLNLDMVGRSSKKLTHPTATRAKAPKRRPPSTLITKENLSPSVFFTFDFKNGDEEYDDDEEESPEDPLVNGDAESHVEKPSNAPPWVEELKLSQAKKSFQNSMQGKTSRVVIGMQSSTSERSISEKTVSERTIVEKSSDKAVTEKSERAVSEKVISEKSISPESKAALVTLRQQPIVGQRPQSMMASFKASTSPPLYPTLSSESITISQKQWNDLHEKVSLLEANFEAQIGALTKAVKDLTGKLDDERQRRMVMQQELEKLTDLVTQV